MSAAVLSTPRAAGFRDHTLPDPIKIAWRDDSRRAAVQLHAFGPLAAEILPEYTRRWREGRAAANAYLRHLVEWWEGAPDVIRDCRDPDAIEKKAASLAAAAGRIGVGALCAVWGLDLPPGSPAAQQARAEDERYWLRVLRRLVNRWWDQLMRLAGFVHRRGQVYCSDQCHRWVTRRQAANLRVLASMLAESDQGDSIPLDQIAMAGTANPENRYRELAVRLRGTEEWAIAQGWDAVFFTVTCPSRYHARYQSGALNPAYDGSTPREAHEYLGRVWARIRAKLKREGLPWCGFRVAEPHHDGCPHWHLLLFCPVDRRRDVERIVRHHALKDSPTEPGARKHRVKTVRIDPKKGSATSYVAKYVAKSIDGGKLESDLYGTPAEAAAQRVVAWARTWGIRQFAFSGSPSVMLYREYRRLREPPMPPHREPWELCDQHRWREWIDYQRGAWPASLIRATGPKTDRYGDPVPPGLMPVVGIEIPPGFGIDTRLKRWTIVRSAAASDARPSAACEPGNLRALTNESASWSEPSTGWCGTAKQLLGASTRGAYVCPDSDCPVCAIASAGGGGPSEASRAPHSEAPRSGAAFTPPPGGAWTRVTNCTDRPRGPPDG